MISNEYSQFFAELEDNNHKEWFHANKKRYEQFVKNPFVNLLEDLLGKVMEFEPEISPNAKDAMFRINKDVRFSKDKTPYNTLMKAGFAPGGKRSELPAYYLGIDKETIHLGGGLYGLKAPQVRAVRLLISSNLERFHGIVEDQLFIDSFGELQGEKAKRLDKDFQDVDSPYIANKQFYAMAKLPLKDYLASEELAKVILSYFKAIHPLQQFLTEAF